MANLFSLKANPVSLPKTVRREIPTRAGSQQASEYILGHNPRKQAYTSEEGVRGIPAFGVKKRPAPKAGAGLRLGSSAPHKTEMDAFTSKHGFPGSFGNTGLTGES